MRSRLGDRYLRRAAIKIAFVLGLTVVSGYFAARMRAESASAVSPLQGIVAAVRAQADEKRAMETMSRVYSTDRWFTFPKFEETALYLAQRLRDSGLRDVEIGGAPADG